MSEAAVDSAHHSGADRRGLFERPAVSFSLDPRLMGWILADPANPLNRIVQSIPDGARVLDVGAGNGILARLLVATGRTVVIDAVEPDPVARDFSATLYREMFACGLETFLETAPSRSERYDVIVMADVVEHLANPEPHLSRLKELLRKGGFIALSTPNIAFASVRLALLDGRFDYVDSGILERTHLRFYTRKTLQTLFEVVALYPTAEYHCLRDPLGTEIAFEGRWPSPWSFMRLANDELAMVYQFVFLLGTEPRQRPIRVKLGSTGPFLPMNYLRRRARSVLVGSRHRLRSWLGRP